MCVGETLKMKFYFPGLVLFFMEVIKYVTSLCLYPISLVKTLLLLIETLQESLSTNILIEIYLEQI